MDNQMQNDQDSTNESEWIVVMSQSKKIKKSVNIIIKFMRYVKNRMDDIRRERYEFNEAYEESYHFCSFCGENMSHCREGGDHSFEIKELYREHRREYGR